MKRSFLLIFLIGFVGITFIGRLFYLQVLKPKNVNPLQSASVKIEYDYPERGYIFDRNGKLLVANQLSYDVMIIPIEVEKLDTLEFCNLLKINKENFIKRFKRAKKYSNWTPSVFLKQLAKEDYAYLQEKLYKYKGFYIQKRNIRDYPINTAGNVLGYLSEVDDETTKKNSYYQQGELKGHLGVEKQYEIPLRGKKGKKHFKRNNLNLITGSFENGKYDTLAIPGKDITLTIDADLQQYGELLMKGKRGGIVAIEPSSGEILALITSPTYNPNMMVGRKRSKNSTILFNDTINLPMFNRSLKGMYPPGSPFKLVNALIGLQEKVITPETKFFCHNGYRYGRRPDEFMGCHCNIFGRPIKLNKGIAKSCNSYFSNTYRLIIEKAENPTIGQNNWSKHVRSFGLGNYLGYDLPEGSPGLIPDGNYYDNRLKYRWNGNSIISNAIGQGEVLTTPIQLANLTAAIANKGFFFTPHIVKKVSGQPITDSTFTIAKKTTINPEYFQPVIDGMYEVFKSGTGKFSQVKGIKICGKTGTSENSTIKNGEIIQLPDHSILVAFAPKENPKIALAVYVENGGYGSEIAAPITSLLIEKYINKEVKRKWIEERMLNLSLQDIYNKQLNNLEFIEEGAQ